VVLGALALSYINFYLIPDTFRTLPHTFGLDFDLTDLGFGIFGFLLVIMMLLRPAGLLPERRRQIELTEGVGADEALAEAHT
jgi:branched-chain amino acid transport system permease protein